MVKAIKKCFLKKLSIWLALTKVAVWVVNYQKKTIYIYIYIYIREFISYLNQLLNNNNDDDDDDDCRVKGPNMLGLGS